MLIWRGFGILVIPLSIILILLGAVIFSFLLGSDYNQAHDWPFSVIMVATAAVIWKWGKWMNSDHPGRHSLFFIPVQWYSILAIFMGIAILGSDSPQTARPKNSKKSRAKVAASSKKNLNKTVSEKTDYKKAKSLSDSNASERGYVHPEFVARFNKAVAFHKNGKNTEAIEAFSNVFKPLKNGEKGEFSPSFFFMTNMQKAFCMMDLGKYEAAEKILSNSKMTALVNQIPPDMANSFYFAKGNISGNLKNFNEMEKSFRKAMTYIKKGDFDNENACWKWILDYSKKYENWPKLLHICKEIHRKGKLEENFMLQFYAMEYGAHAFLHLDSKDKAIRQAKKVLQYYKKAKNSEKIQEWEKFISDNG